MTDEPTRRCHRHDPPARATPSCGAHGPAIRRAAARAGAAAVAAVACALATPGVHATEAAPAEGRLESGRDHVRAGAVWLARQIDGWFGDKPFEDGGRVTDGRLTLRTTWRRDEGVTAALRFGARFELPNLQDRAFFFFGRDLERELVTDRPQEVTRDQRLTDTRRGDQAFFAGLGVPFGDRITFRAGVRGGLKLFTHARYAQAWALSDQDRFSLRETLFWNSSDGFGSTTALSLERFVSPVLTARWVTSGTVAQESDGLEWWSTAGLYRGFGRDRVLAGELLVEGQTGRDVDVSDYGLRASWQQPVHEDWLIGEFSVGHFWPRENAASERVGTWAIGVALTMRF